ncbi:PHD finger protein 14-like isoform X3 [Acyrthosiphon pisum]|uniref:PHD finger protein 14 n=1 Tax=Acyrthosiphon pisum TaxID=7029 RepID=A0A8R2H6G1_ACYPI|nr:PHD finger protein 14-like isoform X3 [Acyrthosiphon pisum]|eukprot:XP_016656123.1 PREDICTED: PHD finger protein 14-like isoform X3 [Acyrthosiphon pisum]
MDRGPNKRRIKPPDNPELLLDYFSESSSDSDFHIEDHYVDSESDSGDSSFIIADDTYTSKDCDNQEETKKDDENNVGCSNGNETPDCTGIFMPIEDNTIKVNLGEIVENIRICSICLGDASDDVNELIDCDECAISVHESCYGVHDSGSVNSSISSCSTEPWFCEACKAGIENPTCELCPNFGGIFKETDCGKWVHLVCALYIPGICFGEVTTLSRLELFKNTTPQWGNKSCTLCKDFRFSSTGMTISCDAGMCRTSFHVTCAQREGGLSDSTDPETDQTDPFYAHCKLHVDKIIVKKRKRNWEILQLRTKQMKLKREQQSSEKSLSWQRNQRWLKKLQSKYDQMKKISKPLITESTFKSKVPRSITTSASSCRALWSKADLMGINMTAQETIEGQIKELRNVPKKWNIPPAFSLEFVSYFTDRNLRLTDLKKQLKHFTEQNNILRDKQKIVQEKYNQDSKNNEILKKKHLELENIIRVYHNIINSCNPNANIIDVDILTREVQNDHNSFNSAAALGLYNKCGICSQTNDQHLLAKCDTCFLYYHLRCLTPPLSRMPKKTKLCGWQCSECENPDPNSEQQLEDPNAPRNSRYSGKGRSISDSHRSSSIANDELNFSSKQNEMSDASKKKKHEQHKDKCSSELKTKRDKSRKRKHKRHRDYSELKPTNNHLANEPPQHAIKLFIKSIPSASGVKTTSQLVIGPQTDNTHQTSITKPEKCVAPIKIKKTLTDIKLTAVCSTCKDTGTTDIMVQCEDCSEYFHFSCLDPPVKKTPKVCGYSWHCQDCDPTDSDY